MRTYRVVRSILVVAVLAACDDEGCSDTVIPPPFDPIHVTSVSPTSMTIEVGETGTVGVTTAGTTRLKNVSGVPVDPTVATVTPVNDNRLLVEGLRPGQTTVSVGPGKFDETGATFEVNVVAPNVTLDISPTEALLAIGQTADFNCVATSIRTGMVLLDAQITYRIADTSIASVDSNGRVTGRAIGFTDLICESASGATATARVGVLAPLTVTIDPTTVQTTPGQTATFVCTVTQPSGTPVTGLPMTWFSSDESTVQVDQNGNATSIKDGQATITCLLDTGESASATVTVSTPTTSVPGLDQIPGNYSLMASKTSDTCPAGLFPSSINNPGPIVVERIGTGTNPAIRFNSNTEAIGIYNVMTGAFSGSGTTMVALNQVNYQLTEIISGIFTLVTDPATGDDRVRMDGTLAFEATPTGGSACFAEFKAVYLGPPPL